MAIVTLSEIMEVGHAQEDGRLWVKEHHMFDDGTEQEYNTLFDAGTDYVQVMNDRATALSTGLTTIEG